MLHLPYLRVYPILYYFDYKKHYFLQQAHIPFLLAHLLHLVLTMTTLFTVMTPNLHMLICIDDVTSKCICHFLIFVIKSSMDLLIHYIRCEESF